MDESLLRLPQVIGRTGLCRTAIYESIKAGEFPRPVKLGARAVAWPSSQINSWIERRIADSRKAA